MKFKPEQWTHHHTHRLFHVSLGLCFGFISIVIVGGMITAFLNASADDNTPKSGNIIMTATVEGVNPGPITGGGSTGGSSPIPTKNPTVSIVAEPQGQVPTEGSAYVFNNQYPAFSGISSVPNGLVFITVRGQSDLNSTVQANGSGYWYWKSPAALPLGAYEITAAVFDSYDLTRSGSAKVKFIIKLLSGQTPIPGTGPSGSGPGIPQLPSGPLVPPTGPNSNILFGAFLNIFPDFKNVEMGKKIMVGVSLISNLGKEIIDQNLEFKVVSPTGKVILQSMDTVSFSKHSEYSKIFYIAPGTPAGKYTILLSTTYAGINSVASDTFEVKTATPIAASQVNPIVQWPILIWIFLLLLLLMFIVLTLMAYRQIRHYSNELQA